MAPNDTVLKPGTGVQVEPQGLTGSPAMLSPVGTLELQAGVAPVIAGVNIAPGSKLPVLSQGAVAGYSTSGVGIYGTSTSANGVMGESDGSDAVLGICHTSAHAGVSAKNDKGGFGLWASGSPAGYFDGDVHVTGTITVDTDIVFSNAADFAEDFQLCELAAEPGTVMVLGEGGGLAPSSCDYDRKVAGVISGAGTYKPGLILDRRPTSDGRGTLALVGKVFCKADASFGAIRPGDLLTTSATPGHAMRADDPLRAFGAVIGKAIGTLASGCGLVPILIALQ